MPLLLWFARYPATYPDTFGRWVLHPAHLRNPIVWFQAVANWGTASTVAALFWSFFSPSHLFLTPDAPGLCGLFLTPVVVPMAVGLYHAFQPSHVQQPATRLRSAIVASCLIGPVAAAMFGHARSDDRALMVVPLGLVISGSNRSPKNCQLISGPSAPCTRAFIDPMPTSSRMAVIEKRSSRDHGSGCPHRISASTLTAQKMAVCTRTLRGKRLLIVFWREP